MPFFPMQVIKIWDLASGKLKLSLTGHVSTVRGLAVSSRQPYLFSCGEDKQVKCWDLEYNKVIRHYHGHLSAIYCLALHPTIDVLVRNFLLWMCEGMWGVENNLREYFLGDGWT